MRTFSEEEARDVFARAAREQQAADEASASGEGLTLDELQEVGRASGLDPAFVAAAAAGLGANANRREARTLLGMPTEVQRSRVMDGPLTDEVWEESVEALRSLFGGPGTAGQIGRVREWRSPTKNGWSGGLETHLTARPLPDGRTRVHVEQHGLRANVWGVVGTGGGMAAMALVPLLVWATGNANGASPFAFAAMAILLSIVLGGGGALWTKQLVRAQGDRFEAALDRIDLLARADAPAPSDLGDEAPPRLDLDPLGDAPDDVRASIRTRTR